MNRSFPSPDDDHQIAPKVSSPSPAFRVALIDLTTAQVVISIGEPEPLEAFEASAPRSAPCASTTSTPIARRCARGRVRGALGHTRARHFGDGPTCP